SPPIPCALTWKSGRMQFLRSERVAAILLAGAAAAGLVIANSPIGAAVIAFRDGHGDTGIPVFDLSPGHWIADGLLALFFLGAARRARDARAGPAARRRSRRRRGAGRWWRCRPPRGPVRDRGWGRARARVSRDRA